MLQWLHTIRSEPEEGTKRTKRLATVLCWCRSGRHGSVAVARLLEHMLLKRGYEASFSIRVCIVALSFKIGFLWCRCQLARDK